MERLLNLRLVEMPTMPGTHRGGPCNGTNLETPIARPAVPTPGGFVATGAGRQIAPLLHDTPRFIAGRMEISPRAKSAYGPAHEAWAAFS